MTRINDEELSQYAGGASSCTTWSIITGGIASLMLGPVGGWLAGSAYAIICDHLTGG